MNLVTLRACIPERTSHDSQQETSGEIRPEMQAQRGRVHCGQGTAIFPYNPNLDARGDSRCKSKHEKPHPTQDNRKLEKRGKGNPTTQRKRH